jgi:hypothetical protein
MTGSSENNFTNVLIDNFNYGVLIQSSYDHRFDNLTIKNVITGVDWVRSPDGVINNSFIDASLISINFSSANPPFSYNNNNVIENTYLGNFSNVISSNWSSISPIFFNDNTYLAGTYTGLCFDDPLNLSCEVASVVVPVVSSSSSITSLPSFGIWSSATSFVLLFGFLFF